MRQTDLAAALGVTDNTLSNWLRGRNDMPAGWLPRIARELGVPLEALLSDARADRPDTKPGTEAVPADAELVDRLVELTPDLLEVLRVAEMRARSLGQTRGSRNDV